MVRIKHSVSTKKRKKRVLKRAKGQFGDRSKRFAQAKRSLLKSLSYADRDRKVVKRDYRQLWISRIKAACEKHDILYSRFIKGLKESKVDLNRKMLAELAIHSPEAFRHLVKLAKEAAPQAKAKKATRKPASKKEKDK